MPKAESPIDNEQIKREEVKLALEKVLKENNVGNWTYLNFWKTNEDGQLIAICSFQLKYEEIAKKIAVDLKALGFNASYEKDLAPNVVIIP